MNGEKSYSSTKIPIDLTKRIDKIIEEKHGGYKSRMEFIKDAIRRRLEQIEANVKQEYMKTYDRE